MSTPPELPKIELHVHLEGTVRAGTLLDLARRNGIRLPADTEPELRRLYEFRDFAHFIDVWMLTTNALRTAEDFRQVVCDYVAEATRHGAVYLEAIFSPAERVTRGVAWAELFEGYCDGAAEAEERFGLIVRLTPDIHRGATPEEAAEVARWAVAFRDRGVVGLGLGGLEERAARPYAPAFAIARDGGLGSVPHAGEITGPASVREALDLLGADRIRHGIRAIGDPDLLAELAGRGVVLDVCPTSNVRTGAVASLAEHPLPALIAAGVACSVSTDDPAMFDTDLAREYAVLDELGVPARQAFDAGVAGALCDEATRERLRAAGSAARWSTAQVDTVHRSSVLHHQ